jgi:3-dehydroquinate synthase
MEKGLLVKTAEGSYAALIVRKYEEAAEFLKKALASKTVVVVSHPRIRRLHGRSVERLLNKCSCRMAWHMIMEGEQAKSLACWKSILDKLILLNADRDAMLVGFGGGVVLDVTGFAASVYKRGIEWISIPTTYLAQVDACIGGKTGINLPQAKNILGTFWQPTAVIVNPSVLATLPRKLAVDGVVEMFKVAIATDSALADKLEASPDSVWDFEKRAPVLIQAALADKAAIISSDLRDKGKRNLLNFGHTLGHALETAAEYKGITHGLAVAQGIKFSFVVAEELNIIKEKGLKRRVIDLMSALQIPRAKAAAAPEKAVKALMMDKKRMKGGFRMALPIRWGEAIIREVDSRMIKNRARIFLLGKEETL